MTAYQFSAGSWVIRQLEIEARAQNASLTAYEKWTLKQQLVPNGRYEELVKKTVLLIRSAITRAKVSTLNPTISISPDLTIPEDWFEGYKTIYTSGSTSVLCECLQQAFKGCPGLGENSPWISPGVGTYESDEAPTNSKKFDEQPFVTPNKPQTKDQSHIGGLVLGALSILISIIGGGAIAIPFGIYAISLGNKTAKNLDSTNASASKTAIALGIVGIALGVIFTILRLI